VKVIVNSHLIGTEHLEIENTHPELAQVLDIPLFANLDKHELEQIIRGLKCQYISRNEYLFHQGSDADSAFFVQSGTLNIISALPGGGDVHLTKLGPGCMVGETSLVSTGIRTASVIAETDVVGFSMERRFFQALLAQASPGAALILTQLIQIVAKRFQSQYAQMIAMEPGSNTWDSCRKTPGSGSEIEQLKKACTFPYQQYLPRFEFFSDFQENEIRYFESKVQCLDLPRDATLFEKGNFPASCFFVIRGALELCVAQGNSQVQLAVLGPGTFLGTTEIISGGVRAACGRVREAATIFEINAENLRDLLSNQTCFGLKFQLALCQSLILDLGKINKRFARITSQTSVKVA
jgi:CRP-like cAMP-binding protein